MFVTLATALIFSAAPFTTASQINVQQTLKAAARVMGSGSARQRGRSLLITGEVALSVTLLIAAALLGQTLYRMHQEQLGLGEKMDRYMDLADARMNRIEESLDGLIRAITAEHSNGKNKH